jgi:hypothetical protein
MKLVYCRSIPSAIVHQTICFEILYVALLDAIIITRTMNNIVPCDMIFFYFGGGGGKIVSISSSKCTTSYLASTSKDMYMVIFYCIGCEHKNET